MIAGARRRDSGPDRGESWVARAPPEPGNARPRARPGRHHSRGAAAVRHPAARTVTGDDLRLSVLDRPVLCLWDRIGVMPVKYLGAFGLRWARYGVATLSLIASVASA